MGSGLAGDICIGSSIGVPPSGKLHKEYHHVKSREASFRTIRRAIPQAMAPPTANPAKDAQIP
jgi:hypothetical protein